MFKKSFKIAIRSLRKQKSFALINISGLTLGLSVALLIAIFARHKISYDRYHPNAERLFRVVERGVATSPPGLAKALKDRYPEFEVITEIGHLKRYLIGTDFGKTYYVSDIITADEHFFKVFQHDILLGDPNTMLSQPSQMVLTKSLAKQLFGEDNPVGKTLTVEAESQYKITGVIKDIPLNTHFRFEAILSLSQDGRQRRFAEAINWRFFGDYIYARLRPNVDRAGLEAKMTEWARDAHPYKPKDFGLFLQPVTKIHLESNLRSEIAPQSDIRYLYFFIALAVVVLMVACFNYVNMATAQAVQRFREIAVRKSCGATRGQLIRQFLAESLLFSLIALPLSLVITEATLPLINGWAGEAVLPGMPFDLMALPFLFGIILLIGLGAGTYPAFFLSSFSPATILGKTAPALKGGYLRKVLVVCQFAATVMLIFATLVIWLQLDYIRNKRLGFEKDYVLTFPSHFLSQNYLFFKETLLQNPDVLNVSSGPPTGIGHKNMIASVSPADSSRGFMMTVLEVDYDYLSTQGLTLKFGRTFSPQYGDDARNSVVLNEEAVKRLVFEGNPIGRIFGRGDGMWRVIGVIEDFHNNSLKSPVQPIAFRLNPGANWNGIVRLNPKNVQAGLEVTQKAWEQFVPERPFEYTFLSERIARQYQTEQRLARIFTFFAGLAVFIACLGLFGLALFAAERRTKEIGIRKVLGASIANVTALLSRDFVKLVLLATVISLPVAWVAMNKWLQNFSYHIQIGWWVFALVGTLALIVAVLTVCTQTVRAALANPSDLLRHE